MIKKLKQLNIIDKISRDKKIYYYFIIFLAGAFAGWIYEEIFYLIEDGILVNRGFLYGPYLPVYGWGAVLMVFLLKRFKQNPLVFFVLAMFVTGILEYFTGYIMWEAYNTRWWDYTGLFLNLDGYICLRSLISFAIGGLLLIYIIEPLICKYINKTNNKTLKILCFTMFVIIVVDYILCFIIRHPL